MSNTSFPTSLNSFTDPLATNSLHSPSRSLQHGLENDALLAVETKMGINSSAVTTTLDYLINHVGASGSAIIANYITQAMLSTVYRMTYTGTGAPGTPSSGDHWFDSTNNVLKMYDGTQWICITPVTASVATSQTTASTSYADLATVGPSLSILTGTQALVTLTCQMSNGTTLDGAVMGYAISGATTLAGSDTTALLVSSNVTVSAAFQHSATYKVGSLTAGTNIFKAQYHWLTAGTSTYLNRSITVVAVPTGG